jgi:hypothetical protein
MQDVNVLVVFPTRGEWIERLALAAAVGAVQGRANIRLRCLEAAADKEFIAPRDADADWADAILAVMAGPTDPLKQYIDSLGAGRGRVTAAAPTSIEDARLQGLSAAEAARARGGRR